MQWHPSYPGSTAANWGGYAPRGGELAGTGPNTQAIRTWSGAGRPHRLTIRRTDDGTWAGLVDGIEVRRLHGGGESLSSVVVWSEVFARCDDPSVVVRWSDFVGGEVRPPAVRLTYQSRGAGGCDNTTARAVAGGLLQVTNVPRELPDGAEVSLLPAP